MSTKLEEISKAIEQLDPWVSEGASKTLA